MEQFPTTSVQAHLAPPAARPMPPDLAKQWDREISWILGGPAKPLESQGILREVEKMSRQLSLHSIPRVYVAAEVAPVLGGRVANAFAIPGNTREFGNAIAVTQRALELFGGHTPHAPMSIELKAILGHELGHIKQGADYMKACRRWPLMIGPAAGVAAFYLYEKASGKAQKEDGSEAIMQKHLDAAAQEALDAITASASGTPRVADAGQWQKTMVSAGKYLVAAALGLAAGGLAARQLCLNLEYNADRTAAILVRDREAIISGLRRMNSDWAQMPRQELQTLGRQLDARSMFQKVLDAIDHAHPTLEERAAALRAMTRQELESLPAAAITSTHGLAESMHP